MKKILTLCLCLALLGGCTVAAPRADDNTNSNISTTAEPFSTTTEPVAEPVAGSEALSTEKVVWGFGKIDNHQQPTEPLGLQERFAPLGAKWLLGEEKTLCLTFDEGYENGFTPSILDTLKEKDVKAIFFVTYDFAESNPDLIRRMIDEGHTVGNHSWHHYSMDELDSETAKEEVLYLHRYINEQFNYTMSYFRFPKGEFSEQTLHLLQELNYESIFWSYAYADWDTDNQPDATKAFTGICESTHAGEILLLHAVSQVNAAILGNVIDDIRQQGYRFTTDI